MLNADSEEFTAFAEARMDRWRRMAFLLCRDWHTSTVDIKAIVRRETRLSTFRRAAGVIALTVAVVTGVSLTTQSASPPRPTHHL